MVGYGKARRNMQGSGLCRNLQNLLKSGLESNTPFSLRVGGFNRSAHSAGPIVAGRLSIVACKKAYKGY